MSHKKPVDNRRVWAVVTVIAVVAVLALVVALVGKRFEWWFFAPPSGITAPEKQVSGDGDTGLIDYAEVQNGGVLKKKMDDRKDRYGVDGGVDLIVKSDESVKIGDMTVSMKEVLEATQLERGEVVEKDITEGRLVPGETIQEYGIYVVQAGDNIWNVHFKLLKNYFNKKGITLSPREDEPDDGGVSSGIGKLLKFSEHMVSIYNLKKRRVDDNLNLIHPLSKIVVYNMREIFRLLERIDYRVINTIQFDGEIIWIPAEQ
jgi:hypothetical protein